MVNYYYNGLILPLYPVLCRFKRDFYSLSRGSRDISVLLSLFKYLFQYLFISVSTYIIIYLFQYQFVSVFTYFSIYLFQYSFIYLHNLFNNCVEDKKPSINKPAALMKAENLLSSTFRT